MKNILVFTLLLLSFSAFGLSLDEARNKGLVTEQANGYLKANNSSAQSLVSEVNAKRKAHYQDVAQKTGATVDQVAARAGAKLQKR